MISWITGWVLRFTGLVGNATVQLIHWGLHAIATAVESVFTDVARAWYYYWRALLYLERTLQEMSAAVLGIAVRTFRYWIPRLVRDIRAAVSELWRLIRWVWTHAEALVSDLRKLAWKWVNDLWHLVLRDVWKPLHDYADRLYHLIIAWAYVAWWWITHLDRLAEALVFHLAASIERHAWELARLLGTFLTALVLHNARRLILLAEQIIAAVL